MAKQYKDLMRRDLNRFGKVIYDSMRWIGDEIAYLARGTSRFEDLDELRDVFETKYPKVVDTYKKTRNNPIDAMEPFITEDEIFSTRAYFALADYIDDNWKQLDKRETWADMIEVLGESWFGEVIEDYDYKNF